MIKVNTIFIISILAVSLSQIGADLYVPSLPSIARGLGSSVSLAQWSVSVYVWGLAFSQLLYGPASDAVGRRLPLVIGLSLLFAGDLVSLLAPTIDCLIAGRLLQGIGAGSGVTLARVILRDLYEGKTLAKMGSYLAICAIGIVASAPVVGGYLLHVWGWRANFVFLSLLALVTLLLVLFKLQETNCFIDRRHLNFRQWCSNVGTLFREPLYFGLCLIIFCCYGSVFAWLTAGPIICQQVFGLSPVMFGWLAGVTALSYCCGSFSNTYLIKRHSILTMLLLGIVLIAVGSLSMLIFSMLFAPTNVLLFIIPMVIVVAGQGFLFPNIAAAAITPFPKIAGVASSLFGFMQSLGGAVTSAIVALIPQKTPLSLSLVLIAAVLVSLVMLWRIRGRFVVLEAQLA